MPWGTSTLRGWRKEQAKETWEGTAREKQRKPRVLLLEAKWGRYMKGAVGVQVCVMLMLGEQDED